MGSSKHNAHSEGLGSLPSECKADYKKDARGVPQGKGRAHKAEQQQKAMLHASVSRARTRLSRWQVRAVYGLRAARADWRGRPDAPELPELGVHLQQLGRRHRVRIAQHAGWLRR